MSGSAVHPVVTVSRKRTRDQVPTGKFEGTAEGVDAEDGDGGVSVVVGELELESELVLVSGLLSLPAGVEPSVVAGALLVLLVSSAFADDKHDVDIPLCILLQSHG